MGNRNTNHVPNPREGKRRAPEAPSPASSVLASSSSSDSVLELFMSALDAALLRIDTLEKRVAEQAAVIVQLRQCAHVHERELGDAPEREPHKPE